MSKTHHLKNKILEYEDDVFQWEVFPPLLKVMEGRLFLEEELYPAALESYLEGYAKLVDEKGYGHGIYDSTISRFFDAIDGLPSSELRKDWLVKSKKYWNDKKLNKEYSGFIRECDNKLLTLEMRMEVDND